MRRERNQSETRDCAEGERYVGGERQYEFRRESSAEVKGKERSV